MLLRLPDARRVAAEVGREEDSALLVFAATNGEGASDYSEVMLRLHRPSTHPAHVVIGIRRNADEPQVRRLLRDRLRDQLRGLSLSDPASFFPIRTDDVT